MQINRASGRARPLRVNGSIASVMADSDDDDDEDDDIMDDPAMPNEYRCPITQMPMKKPVMMCDGHSYEYRAIQKWLLKKQTSPVTGKTLSNTTMTVNHALKKLIRDWDSGTTALAAAARAKSPGAGSSRTSAEAQRRAIVEGCDEDLFGSSDDEAPTVTDAIANVGSSNLANPTDLYVGDDRVVVQDGIVLSHTMDFGERSGRKKKKMKAMRKEA